MTLSLFRSQNHPQQVGRRGVKDDIDDRGTPLDLFMAYDRMWHFTVDVAAAAHNTKCERFYDKDADGLAQSWADETVWCNPPYSDIRPWVAKAWAECPTANGIVMLLPANRTEQTWWQDLVEGHRDHPTSPLRVHFLPGRIRFLKAGAERVGANERPPFGSVVLTWERHAPIDSAITDEIATGSQRGLWPERTL